MTNAKENTVLVIDTTNDSVINTIPVASGGPVGISATSDGRKVYVTYYNSAIVSVIDTYSNKVIRDLPAGGPSWISGKFISPNQP